MAKENKTQPSEASVSDFLNGLAQPRMREDCLALAEIMGRVTGYEPVLWSGIVGYGRFDYQYPTGRSGRWFGLGFAPRSNAISVYLCLGDGQEQFATYLTQLGKHKMGAGCLYINRLSDVDLGVLEELLREALERNRANPVLTEVLN